MNKVRVEILSHNGTMLKDDEMTFLFLPRVGETIVIDETLEDTDTFIVTDVKYVLKDNIMNPLLECESFYPHPKGALSRLHYLHKAHWLKEGCGHTNLEEDKGQ